MELECFSEDDFALALKRNIRALTVGKTPSVKPEAILLGGQSGAGKTLLHRIKKEEFQGNIIIIDGDLFRFQHPNYEELSHLSTLIRYEEMYSIDKFRARATEKAIHDEIVQHLVDNIERLEQEKIFEKIQVYQRDSSCIYDSERDSGKAAQKVKETLFGQWSLFEEEMLKSEEKRLKELQERNDSVEEG